MYRLLVVFYRSGQGHEPVRDWLRELPQADRKVIGEDLKTVQLGWPLGMPVVRKLDRDLWEVRIGLRAGIARVLFTIHDGAMVLLHGFVKKSQKTPRPDLELARTRLKEVQRG